MRQIHANRQAQKIIKTPHIFGVAPCQIIIDSHHMNAFARQGIQINRQGRRQRFPLSCAHFRNFSFVQRNPSYQLHIKVTQLQHTLGSLTHHCKGFRQYLIQRLALVQAPLELLRFSTKLLVTQ